MVTFIHLVGWSKSRTPTASNAFEDVGQQKLSYIAGGIQNNVTSLENDLAFS